MEPSNLRIKVKAIEIPLIEWRESNLTKVGHREYLVRACFTFWDPANRKSEEAELDQSTEVWRRFSDFTSLLEQLQAGYPGCIVPPLPDKSLMNMLVNNDSTFIEERRRELRRFLKRVTKHRVLGQTPEFLEFLRNDRFYHN